jgi:hypothetical protein
MHRSAKVAAGAMQTMIEFAARHKWRECAVFNIRCLLERLPPMQ